MDVKPIYQSWTMIFNTMAVVAESVAGGQLDGLIPSKYQVAAVAIANLLLRLKTSNAVVLK